MWNSTWLNLQLFLECEQRSTKICCNNRTPQPTQSTLIQILLWHFLCQQRKFDFEGVVCGAALVMNQIKSWFEPNEVQQWYSDANTHLISYRFRLVNKQHLPVGWTVTALVFAPLVVSSSVFPGDRAPEPTVWAQARSSSSAGRDSKVWYSTELFWSTFFTGNHGSTVGGLLDMSSLIR